ncbi:hypothetical protein Hdeb2414_s0010g00330371 [Helianthus debilis subsp. tardiflorus]
MAFTVTKRGLLVYVHNVVVESRRQSARTESARGRDKAQVAGLVVSYGYKRNESKKIS